VVCGLSGCPINLSSGADMEGHEVGGERRGTLGLVEVLGLGFTRSPTGAFICARSQKFRSVYRL
jgi:hypothetical protein